MAAHVLAANVKPGPVTSTSKTGLSQATLCKAGRVRAAAMVQDNGAMSGPGGGEGVRGPQAVATNPRLMVNKLTCAWDW